MVWNKSNHLTYARTRKRFIIAKARQDFANGLGIPVYYLQGRSLSKQCFTKLQEINKIFIEGCDKLTCKLSRKLKKKFRKQYRKLKI